MSAYCDDASGDLMPTGHALLDGPSPADDDDDTADRDLRWFRFVAWSIVGFSIALLGLVGNALSIVVLRHPSISPSTRHYLTALAVFDSGVLAMMIVAMSLPSVFPATCRLAVAERLYPYAHFVVYPTALISQTASIYTTVAFTAVRYIAVSRPLRAALVCTAAAARRVIAVVVVGSVVVNVPRMLEYRIVTSPDVAAANSTTTSAMKVEGNATSWTAAAAADVIDREFVVYNDLTEFGRDPTFRRVYFIGVHMIFMLVVPFAVLAVVNVKLMRALKMSSSTILTASKEPVVVADKEKEMPLSSNGIVTSTDLRGGRGAVVRTSVGSGNSGIGKLRRRGSGRVPALQERSMTTMLVAVVAVFLVCQALSIVDNVLATVVGDAAVTDPFINRLSIVSSLFVITNSATNFYLYCLFGQRFRRTFALVICRYDGGGKGGGAGFRCCCCRRRRDGRRAACVSESMWVDAGRRRSRLASTDRTTIVGFIRHDDLSAVDGNFRRLQPSGGLLSSSVDDRRRESSTCARTPAAGLDRATATAKPTLMNRRHFPEVCIELEPVSGTAG